MVFDKLWLESSCAPALEFDYWEIQLIEVFMAKQMASFGVLDLLEIDDLRKIGICDIRGEVNEVRLLLFHSHLIIRIKFRVHWYQSCFNEKQILRTL